MASRVIYPPIVDSQMKAFLAGQNDGNSDQKNKNECRIYFSLSKFNSFEDLKSTNDAASIHISIVEQVTNKNYVNISPSQSGTVFRSTGIILDAPFIRVEGEDNLFYTIINADDVSPNSGATTGWTIGRTYKVQLRISIVKYAGSEISESAWLKNNEMAGAFSEWSTICVIKATGKVDYKIPLLGIDTTMNSSFYAADPANDDKLDTFEFSTLDLFGTFLRADETEYIKSFQFILYDADDNILENSGTIFIDSFENNIDSFNYLGKTELEDQHIYKLAFKFETEHGYVDGFYLSETADGTIIDHRFKFLITQITIESPRCTLITVDNDPTGLLDEITSVSQEEDNGRIGLKFYCQDEDPYSGNLCIRRTDSRSDFKVWDDIKIYVCVQESINKIPIIYDYTIESGVWYKYGVQKISTIGERGITEQIKNPIMRNFNYSFLLGQNNKQLRLMFDNTMPNYKYQIIESKIDPINAVYPIVTRNAATKYKTFPINGLISFWMDDDNTFTSRAEVYNYSEIAAEKYQTYNEKNNIRQYDYIYEREFRNKVLDFLCDGEFKLFKSPTEGNVIVRLTDVNCVPNQSLDRMLYSFTSNAYEMAEPTMANYRKYNFYDPGTYGTEFSTFSVKLGQIQIDVPVNSNSRTTGYNILKAIYEKYDSRGQNCGGYLNTVGDIYCLKITFDGKPLKIRNGNSILLGHSFRCNRSKNDLSVLAPNNIYEFDEKLRFSPLTDEIVILGDTGEDSENRTKTIYESITVDFLYELKVTTWTGKEIKSRSAKSIIGEFFEECEPNKDIYKELFYKYYIEWNTQFRRLNRVASIEIEANPGTVMLIQDESDSVSYSDEFVIGDTGKLNLHELSSITGLKYKGVRRKDGTIDETVRQDILVKYNAIIFDGMYKTKGD